MATKWGAMQVSRMATGLTSTQREVLRALCDTFLPPSGDPSDGTGAPLYARVEQLIGMVEDPAAAGQLGLLLTMLANPLAVVAQGGPLKSIPAMSVEQRIRFLHGMGASRLQLRRAGFQALKRLIHVAYYAFPAGGGGHPAWREAGYPGPLPHRADERNQPLRLLAIDGDTTLDCDVVVIGSGAGGGVAAGVLAGAGLDVVVLEKGEYRLPKDFTHVEGEGLADNYLDHGLLMNRGGSLPVLAGSGLGGGTVINYTTSFRLPDHTADEWSRRSGLSLFTSARWRESADRVLARLHVSEECAIPSRRDLILEDGCRTLGWHSGVIPRNAQGCPSAEECGYCGYGCRHHAKQSTAETYLADAVRQGARIVVRCDARRVTTSAGRATGVEASVRCADGARVSLTVRAKMVIAACGSVNTPPLLVRSGIRNPNVGRGLRLHPGTAVAGMFNERVESWVGYQQTRYSDQFANLHDGYGVKFETVPLGFVMPASAFGWESPGEHRATMKQLAHIGIVGLLLRDRDGGRVATGRDGRGRVDYELSRWDEQHVRTGVRAAAELLASQGAREIFTVQQPPVRMVPGGAGWLDRFMEESDRRGYARARQAFISFHQMASCAMGSDPRRSVVAETGESHDVRGLYVADASAFVTSSGVNPMITIMTLADHVSRHIVETWDRGDR